jgi:hypothetical protein
MPTVCIVSECINALLKLRPQVFNYQIQIWIQLPRDTYNQGSDMIADSFYFQFFPISHPKSCWKDNSSKTDWTYINNL